MVYQDLALAGNMPIYENIYLGREPGRKLGGLTIVDHARRREMASEHLDQLKIHVKSVDQNVEELSGGQRQAVAIARATAFDAKVVIMDEPTAALAIKEVGKVLDLIKIAQGARRRGHRHLATAWTTSSMPATASWRSIQGTNFADAPLEGHQPQRSDRLDHGHQGPHRRPRPRQGPLMMIGQSPSRCRAVPRDATASSSSSS